MKLYYWINKTHRIVTWLVALLWVETAVLFTILLLVADVFKPIGN